MATPNSSEDHKPAYLQLVTLVQQWDHHYHVRNSPLVPDAVYDAGIKRLLELEERHPDWRVADSPTQRVGSGLTGTRKKVQHVKKMLSLDNVFDVGQLALRLAAVADRVRAGGSPGWVVEPKVDGLSMSLLYADGVLVQALTRGDGEQGEDVTANVRTIKTVPLRLTDLDDAIAQVPIEVRGEVFMSTAEFQKWNLARVAAGEAPAANPRNAAAGAIMLLDSNEAAKRPLRFVPYTAFAHQDGPPMFATHRQQQRWLAAQGFSSLQHWFAEGPEEAADLVVKFNEVWRAELGYPTDGAVVKLDSVAARALVGEHDKAPRWAFAFKYQAERAETILQDITVQVGKTGVLTPVAELQAVELSGSVIRRASLHNFDMLAQLNVAIGDTVLIEKAGEIIPYVLAVVSRPSERKAFSTPTVCPCCGTVVERVTNVDGADGVALVCLNTSGCKAQIAGRLEKWCGRSAMDMESVGPALVEQLVQQLGVVTPLDLYTLDFNRVRELPGMGDKKTTNLKTEIERSKEKGMQAVLVGLCIPRIGETASKKLARHFPSIRSLVDAVKDGTFDMPGFGAVNTAALKDWLGQPANLALLDDLGAADIDLKSKSYNPDAATGPFAGQVVVFTGTLEKLERDVARAKVEALGGRTSGSVSGKTTLLVAGAEAGSKLTKAKAAGIKVIDEAEFLVMLET